MADFAFNNQYLTRDGKPWFPVMGEIHYTRYREDLWEESLRKMKAGGLSIVSTYVIWIHHEEEEGVFDFTGTRNLKRFIEAAETVGIEVFLRLGPWVHGEVRNGGFPDWLQKQEGEIKLRSDDPAYLELVRRFWTEIYKQVEGKMYSDGGPIVGVQIENEYGHVGGLIGEEGEQHMRTLTELAKSLGFVVPMYTATGWGGAVTGGLLPVMGGYCEAPWAQTTDALPANENYVFSDIRNDSLIASDHKVQDELTYDVTKFPYLTAELGGGLQVTKHRRPVATGRDIGAMSLVKLGSGVGLLGYYMYHGGSNPEGKFSTLQESIATGYLNDLPEINYDFNAPIRQYGTISDNYKEIRLIAQFVHDFGEDLATLQSFIPETGSDPEDTESLRYAIRHDDDHGYIFFNNYQRQREMREQTNVRIDLPLEGETLDFPAFDIPSGAYGFYPYRLPLGRTRLNYATATPVCRLLDTNGEETYIFYGSKDALFSWEADREAKTLLISREDALNASRVTLDQDYLVVANDYVWTEDGRLVVTGPAATEIKTYPALTDVPTGFTLVGTEDRFTVYRRALEASNTSYELVEHSRSGEAVVYDLRFCYEGAHRSRVEGRDTLVYLDYAAESMDLEIDGQKRNDYFYTGQDALISLGYLGFPEELRLTLYPLREDTKVYLEAWPELENGQVAKISCVRVEEQYR